MPRPAPPAPRTGIDQRFRADREPRWCVSADRLRANRGGPGWRVARQWQRRPPPTPTRPPTSAPSGRLRLPPPRVRPYATPSHRFWFRPEILQHDPGLAASALLTGKSRCEPGSGLKWCAEVLALAAATDMAGAAHRRHLETPSPEIVRFPGTYGGGGNRTRVRGRTG